MTPEHPVKDVDGSPADGVEAKPASAVRGRRRTVAWVITTLACLLVFLALVAPNELSQLTPWAFLRIPIEALVGAALVLVLPPTPKRIVAAVLGALLGLLTILKLLDMGFYLTLSMPFDPVFGWSYLGPSVNFLYGALGNVGAVATIVGVVLAAAGLVVLMTLSAMRLSRIVALRPTAATRVIAVLGVIWIVLAFTGTYVATGQPIAARSTAVLGYDSGREVGEDIQDNAAFAKASAVDRFQHTPASQLLTKLRGKNVLFVFVESYGRSSVQGNSYSPSINAVLDAGTKELNAAGFSSESAFVTSPSVGGGSWLGHSTLQSGLWINSQYRYDDLLGLNRVTLNSAFEKAGWRTVGDDPANITTLPKATVYNYDRFYDALNVGYRGPKFSYATMPDQYVMSVFQHNELSTPDHQPVMAEIDLVSSHDPWTPLPKLVPWNAVGNGSIFDPMPAAGPPPSAILSSPTKLRAAYAQSIRYTLSTLISYLKAYGNKNTVMVFLGDEQPPSVITNNSPNRDVPITIVAGDPSVIQQTSSWDWQSGLHPRPNAPVWPMSAFRNKFLSAFGSK
jgi:hypothetical protein